MPLRAVPQVMAAQQDDAHTTNGLSIEASLAGGAEDNASVGLLKLSTNTFFVSFFRFHGALSLAQTLTFFLSLTTRSRFFLYSLANHVLLLCV